MPRPLQGERGTVVSPSRPGVVRILFCPFRATWGRSSRYAVPRVRRGVLRPGRARAPPSPRVLVTRGEGVQGPAGRFWRAAPGSRLAGKLDPSRRALRRRSSRDPSPCQPSARARDLPGLCPTMRRGRRGSLPGKARCGRRHPSGVGVAGCPCPAPHPLHRGPRIHAPAICGATLGLDLPILHTQGGLTVFSSAR